MKKMTFIACAAMLTSAIALNSCQSGEQNGPEGPQYEGDEVKTEFAISLPASAVGGPNKMKGTTVQKDGLSQFQGITGLFLVPFVAQDTVEGTDTRLGKNIILSGNVNAAEAGRPSAAKVYTDVAIPLTTGSFLLYGKSAYDGTKFQAGSLLADTANAYATPAEFKFSLEQIRTSAQIDSIMGTGKRGGLLMAYLTSVAIASDGEAVAKRWYEYPATGDSVAFKALFDTLATMHGLSSFEVERVLSDLYKTVNPLRGASKIAKAIADSINNGTYATISNDSVKLVAGLKNFPTVDLLPEGSLETKWNGSTHKFEAGTYAGDHIADPSLYTYPAQLWYRVNSKIQTSNKSEQTAYDNSNDWDDILAEHDDATYVNSRTRAVAY